MKRSSSSSKNSSSSKRSKSSSSISSSSIVSSSTSFFCSEEVDIPRGFLGSSNPLNTSFSFPFVIRSALASTGFPIACKISFMSSSSMS
ncbi:MAG: hypothetical protein DRP25_05020 [Thermotoga sp.]|nr:MAG: hypothetical protein DRP23_04120 [Thermotogota bacterium]RKX50833.1 MAG: hypothetical protein DRP25_05020 [Thermotoga sp.]